MKAIDRPFTNIINGTTQFVIPVFQRDYSWTEEECEQLWRDILLAAQGGPGGAHFLGSIVYISTGDSSAGFTRWLLIDGQQRVTTFTLLLTALRDHIRETNWRGTEDDPTPRRVEAYFLKNLQEEGEREHKLVLRRHDQATLRAFLDKTEMPAEPSDRLRDNYEFFRERLAGADPAEVYSGIGRLIVVDVTLDRGTDDPQLIFESLNSTGMDLSQADLIRNFILMRLDEREQTRLYEGYWNKIEALFRRAEKPFDAFVRDYVALKTQASKQEKADHIYRAFHRIYPDLERELDGLQGTLADLLRYARYYAAFSIGGEGPADLQAALARLRGLVDVPAILVMRLFDCYERVGTLTVESFREALSLVESYILRRAICGEQTRGYWQMFASLAYRLDEQNPMQSLQVALARQRESYRFPGDDDFRRELVQRDIYGLRVCGFLLDRLENHGTREPTDTSAYSIEHILPQNEKLPQAWRAMLGNDWKTIRETWLHRLGNLTLTGYNSSYSDRPFEEKKTMPGGFEESSVRLNKSVREQPKWTEIEIERRGELLAERALEIWPALHVDPAAIEAARQAELRELAARRDVRKVQMSAAARQLFDQLSPRIRELGPDILELAEGKSVSYHGPDFFLEVLPRKRRLTLLLPLEYGEVDDPTGLAEDATEWKFFVNAKYEGGVSIRVNEAADIERALPIIRQSLVLSNA